MKLRRQVYELKIEDLEQHPCWEFCLDEEGIEGQDEATVRPFIPEGALQSPAGTFIVSAGFSLADGTKFPGYLYGQESFSEQDKGNLGFIQPVIVTAQGQVPFWFGIMEPGDSQIKECYAWLGKKPSEVFPVSYASKSPVNSITVTGSLEGFYFFALEKRGWLRPGKQVVKFKK